MVYRVRRKADGLYLHREYPWWVEEQAATTWAQPKHARTVLRNRVPYLERNAHDFSKYELEECEVIVSKLLSL